MKWLLTLLFLTFVLFIGWYFYAPEDLLAQDKEEQSKDRNPIAEAIDTLFRPAADVFDRDGNRYPATIIGSQTWMGANLRVTSCNSEGGTEMLFSDGKEKGPGVKFYDSIPRYGYYLGRESLGYGVLYTHAAVLECHLCPDSWRVATKADWEELFEAIGPESFRGSKLTTEYKSPFNADWGGRVDGYGSVLGGSFVFWWASDKYIAEDEWKRAWGPEMQKNGEVRIVFQDARAANYVRCVKNKEG